MATLTDIDTALRALLAPLLVGGDPLDAIHNAVFSSPEEAAALLASEEYTLPAGFLSFPSGQDLPESGQAATCKSQSYRLTYHFMAASGGEDSADERFLFLADVIDALHVNLFYELPTPPPTNWTLHAAEPVGWETVYNPKSFAFVYTFELTANGPGVATV